MFSAALFIMAKIWKQPKCPLIDEWIKKMWKYTRTHTHTHTHTHTRVCVCVCVCIRLSQTCLWVFECLLQRHGSGVACCGDRVPGCSRPASHSLWHKPTACGIMEEVAISPIIKPLSRYPQTVGQLSKEILALLRKFKDPQQISQPEDLAKGLRTPREFDFRGEWDLITELPQGWGNRFLEGTNKTLCAQEARRKEKCPHKRMSQTSLWVSRSLQWRVNSLASGQTIGRKHSPTHQQKIGLKIYWAWPQPSEQDPGSPLSQLFPSGSFHKPLIPLHQRADRMKTTITENKSNWSYGSQPCLTQCKYQPCSVGPPKTDGS